MSTPVILRPLPQAEFDDAADYYERRAAHGAAFTAVVAQLLVSISANPELYPEVHATSGRPAFRDIPTPSTTGSHQRK